MQENYTTKSKTCYSHLYHDEREIIMLRLYRNVSQRKIAHEINRSPSSITREIKRNCDMRTGAYRAFLAQKKAETRRKNASRPERLNDHILRRQVEERLCVGWSPEQIAGRLKLERNKFITNHESIYLWIYNDRPDLTKYLVRSGKKRRKRAGTNKKRAQRIPNRTSIEKRPESANCREEAGHWEADTAVSRESKAALSIMTERKHKLTFITKLVIKTSLEMKHALIKRLGILPPHLRHTITYDNGLENVLHEEVNEILETESFFCNPYHSWEKGTVENTIGLVRQYLPKKTDFNLVDNKKINEIEYALNNRPRKCLGYLTPLESINRDVALHH